MPHGYLEGALLPSMLHHVKFLNGNSEGDSDACDDEGAKALQAVAIGGLC
jgi:hypothetical protein